MPRFVSVLLVFGGYMLVYAATARGGVFATEPWNGLMFDAYGDLSVQQGGTAMQQAVSSAIGDVQYSNLFQ